MSTLQVVTVCHRRDLWIWRYSQHLIPINLEGSKYTIIVDDNDLSLFKLFTTSLSWQIIPASTVLDLDFSRSLRMRLKQADRSLNPGWYWQQFLKIQFIMQQKNSLCVVWDADTIPLKKVQFPSDISGFYQPTTEYHKPYWSLNSSLLGQEYGKYPGFSFISQFFGIQSEIVHDMTKYICNYTSYHDWKESCIHYVLNLYSRHRMSEYELMGAYALKTCTPNDFLPLSLAWTRQGASRTTNIFYPSLEHLLDKDYVYAAFERRDIANWTTMKDRLLRLCSLLLSLSMRSLLIDQGDIFSQG